jgi:hypothetical protein
VNRQSVDSILNRTFCEPNLSGFKKNTLKSNWSAFEKASAILTPGENVIFSGKCLATGSRSFLARPIIHCATKVGGV